MKKQTNYMLIAQGGEVKSKEEGVIEGLGIVFGSAEKTDQSAERDYFDATSKINPSETFTTHLAFEHGLKKRKEPIGKAVMTKTENGWEVSAELDMEDPFVKNIFPKIKSGEYGFSTGATPLLVKREKQANGANHLKQWFVGEISITERPAERDAMITAVKCLDEESETKTAEELVEELKTEWMSKFVGEILSQVKSDEVNLSDESIDKIIEKLPSTKVDNSELAELKNQLATKTQELADLEGKLQVGEDALKEANDQIARLSLLAGVEDILKEK